jgi:Zn-dependent M28 family amino/carboxypeptidase
VTLRSTWTASLGAALALLVGVSAAGGATDTPSAAAQPARTELAQQLSSGLSLAHMRADLVALERIADRSGGNRAAGTPGYAASVAYVRTQLRRAGYAPRATPFPFVEYLERLERGRQVVPVERNLPLEALEYSPPTPRDGLRARVVESGDGCSAGDFGDVRGAIALVERGTCFFAVKAGNAQRAGAVGLLVFNNEAGPLDGTLGDPRAATIPVAALARNLGLELTSATGVVVEMELDTQTRNATTHNVLADAQRRATRVLVIGAHLDSVRAGPGVNDNGTGVAALLEIARVLRKSSSRLNVQFAFWGAEELGLFGSRAYARTLDPQRIVGYLNFDVLGSPTRSYGVYEGGRYAARWLRYF